MLPTTIVTTSSPNGESSPSFTYKLDLKGNRVLGMIDGVEAVCQAIDKILHTERYTDVIYDGKYGIELQSLIGMSFDYVEADLPRRIEEALLQDDRIVEVTSIVIEKTAGDSVLVTLTIMTVFGNVSTVTEGLI